METLELIRQRLAKAVIVGKDPWAGTVNDLLLKMGFVGVRVIKNLSQLYSHIKMHPADWIITELQPFASTNALAFLKGLNEDVARRRMKVSLFVNRGESMCLPAAYEFGLFSWHNYGHERNEVKAELDELMKEMVKLSCNDAAVASVYLRKFLKSFKAWDELLNLELSLNQLHMGDPTHALHLAEAQFLAGEYQQGKLTLDNVAYFDPEYTENVAELYEQHVGKKIDEVKSFADEYSLKSAVVVDKDRREANVVISVLEKMGFGSIKVFDDGKVAFQYLEDHPEPDPIVQEWRIPGVSGPYLLQRVRASGKINVPIIVISSLISERDTQLVRDMSVSQVLKKPLREKQVLMATAWSLAEYRRPREEKSMERKMIQALKQDDMVSAFNYRGKLDERKDKIHPARILYLDGAMAYYQGYYEKASGLLIKSINQADQENIDAMGLLASCLMRLGDYAAAVQLMERVTILSPQNLLRLCELADMQLEAGATAVAGEIIQRATELDDGNVRVTETRAKEALLTGSVEQSREFVSALESLQEVVTFMNNHAVGLVKTGRNQDGIALYEKALASLDSRHGDYRVVISYNLALALIRSKELRRAMQVMAKFPNAINHKVGKKLLSLRRRVKIAIEKGTQVQLISSSDELLGSDGKGQEKKTSLEDLDKLKNMIHGGACLIDVYKEKSRGTYSASLLKKAG